MKRICLILIMICWVLLSINAQSSSVRVCTEEEIPASQRKRFLKVAENFLENYYNNLFLNINDDIVQESFINNYMVNGTQRYKPEFPLNIPGQSQYLMPEQYLQELSKQFKTENFEEWMLEVTDITFDKDFKATNNLDCFVTAHYTLTLNNGENKLYSRSCTALCYWSQSRMYDQVRLMQVEPVKDIIAYQPVSSDTDNTTIVLGTIQDALDFYDKKEYYKAVPIFTKYAQQGNAKAQSCLGYCYTQGLGVEKNFTEAVKWYTKAAEQGHADGQYNLGFAYYNGYAVPKDYEKAREWFTKAAKQGKELAMDYLGVIYYNGEGVTQDYEKAFEWFTKAAEMGYVIAEYHLAICYELGQGVPQDDRKAFEWYTKAALKGNANAQNNLGVYYATGKVVPKDYKKAKEWFTKAAEQGDVEAYSSLEKLKNIMK